MNLEPIYSETAVESLYLRGLARRMTPELQSDLQQIGIDLARPLLPGYHQAVWDRGLQCVARRLFANLPPDQAYFEVGRCFMAGFEHTLVGKAVVQLGKLIGPERTLHRMQRSQRTTNTYSLVSVEKLAPTHFRLHASIEPLYLPSMVDVLGVQLSDVVRGIYASVLGLLEVRSPRVTSQALSIPEFRYDYDLSWER